MRPNSSKDCGGSATTDDSRPTARGGANVCANVFAAWYFAIRRCIHHVRHPGDSLRELVSSDYGAFFLTGRGGWRFIDFAAFQSELSLYSYIGMFMLIGIVKKNGIMMVDFAVEQRRAGKTPVEAVHEASVERFRPIIMTTLAALMGAIPIALGLERMERLGALSV